MNELSHGVLKSEKKVCSAFRLRKTMQTPRSGKEKAMPVSESTLCAAAHIFRISRFHLMTCKNSREKASFYKFYRVCIALIKSCFWGILGLTYRKKTERSEQFLRLAMCGLRVCANYRTRIEIRPHCLLGFSPAKNDANSAQRKRKGLCKFPVCDGTPSPHIVILIAVFLPDLQKQPRKSKFL